MTLEEMTPGKLVEVYGHNKKLFFIAEIISVEIYHRANNWDHEFTHVVYLTIAEVHAAIYLRVGETTCIGIPDENFVFAPHFSVFPEKFNLLSKFMKEELRIEELTVGRQVEVHYRNHLYNMEILELMEIVTFLDLHLSICRLKGRVTEIFGTISKKVGDVVYFGVPCQDGIFKFFSAQIFFPDKFDFLSQEELLKIAKQNPPDQSWFEGEEPKIF